MKKLVSTVGTYVVVGAASAAGAALWTNVLEDKVRQLRYKAKPKSSKVIDFKEAKRSMGR
jgi:hypothetical protein